MGHIYPWELVADWTKRNQLEVLWKQYHQFGKKNIGFRRNFDWLFKWKVMHLTGEKCWTGKQWYSWVKPCTVNVIALKCVSIWCFMNLIYSVFKKLCVIWCWGGGEARRGRWGCVIGERMYAYWCGLRLHSWELSPKCVCMLIIIVKQGNTMLQRVIIVQWWTCASEIMKLTYHCIGS